MTNSCILSRVARLGRWRFSSAAAVETPSLLIPTRHSRHAPPPACLSAVQLHEITEEVLKTPPGALIRYLTSERDDSVHAWESADIAVQKVEWLIRGYSAHVSNTIMHKIYPVESMEDPAHCILKIKDLLRKLEKEGNLYMELRQKVRLQLDIEARNGLDEDSDDDEEAETSVPQVFASPGQTIAMFDTLLDTMAVTTSPDTPCQVGDIVTKVNLRFEQDGGQVLNVNPSTVPTQLTYNAALRAIANTPNCSDKTRDDALLNAFGIFDSLIDKNVKRNAATFNYMIQTVSKFVPPSEMAGNIARALWMMAVDRKVVDDNIMRALEQVDPGNYPMYEEFVRATIREKTIKDIPHNWRKWGKSQRYDSSDATY